MTFAKAVETLNRFADLKPGWDSYSGKPISPVAIDWAKAALFRLGDGWVPVPTSDGGVQLEFHHDGVDMELMINEAGRSSEGGPQK